MDSKLLNLHFAQLSSAWNYSKDNIYSDAKKSKYHNNLKILYSKIRDEDFSKYDENKLATVKSVCDFFFKSLEFLNSSTLNHIPFEIVKCLELALSDWENDKDDFIIVTSLVNNIHNFSFDPSLAFNDGFYNLIERLYSIEFSSRLIQINLPAYLDKDYLANVVLYHELGHFVDIKLSVSKAIYEDILNRLSENQLTSEEIDSLRVYFPYITNPVILTQYRSGIPIHVFSQHIAEYFCDLFAAQYVNSCSNHYLNYLTEGDPKFSQSHPSTINRVKMVESFLDSDESFTLSLFRDAVSKCTSGKELTNRSEKFESENFQNLIPVDIINNGQLHYLFSYGWNLWLGNWEEFQSKNNMGFQLNRTQVYHLINNLIEKSIGNYIIVSNWQKHS